MRAPGTVTVRMPELGMLWIPWLWNHSGLAATGARPLALRPSRRFSGARWMRAKASPPMPTMWGSTTLRVARAATAASTALPPCSSTRQPARLARGWLVATTPRGAMTTERWAKDLISRFWV